MNPLSYKRRCTFKVVVPLFLVFLAVGADPKTTNALSHETSASEPAPVTITDDEIDGFLFRVNEDVRNKVMVLGGEPVEQLPVPILFGIPIGGFTDTWGETQTGGRVHAGIDIMADRGALVVSPTDAVVTKIGYDNRGGNFVVTANPGGEQFYFAHLDRAAENLSVGDVLTRGDLIGYVGNTGNARSTAPHLHLGIYYKGIARNPFQRLIREFSIEERLASVEHILTENKIILGEHNGGVRFLQRFLIQNGTGPRATALAKIGATGYFGPFTKNALVEYQKTASIVPASGYFGLVTRTHIVTKLLVNINAEDKTGASNKLQLFDL